ncbi:hypothetical protein MTQ01_06825 [Streptomyces sp. XM4193]|uniref:hypothetical protein n=1 Tax=Streptomyces sp. XM4193 TaxID=2929782 RepID=UPI001FFB95F7|nr:hypothetical protein [Streptomyces sp. XM4193]MCK1795727.1 hypothetical protein [Streptomyces sp. XM4193]
MSLRSVPRAPRLVSVIGNSPGVGKSTLASALADGLAREGSSVDHFEEADILTRPAFAPVVAEFGDGDGAVRPATLVAATREYVRQSREAGVEWLVTDALVPFLPSLVAWGHDERALEGVLEELVAALEPLEVVLVWVRDDPAVALRRAVAREGAAWERWYVDKLAAAPGTSHVHDLASAADQLRAETELTGRLLARTPWQIVPVDVATLDAEAACSYVRRQLPV